MNPAYAATTSAKFQFGVPLTTSDNSTRAGMFLHRRYVIILRLRLFLTYSIDWMLFAAAIVTDPDVRTRMIGQVISYNSQSLLGANQPFLVVYDAATGAQGAVGQGSPAVGAMFAPLALSMSKKPIGVNTNRSKTGCNVGGTPQSAGNVVFASQRFLRTVIAVAAVGGLASVVGAVVLVTLLCYR